MAEVKRYNLDASLTVTLELTETEVRALDGIFGYSVEQFLKVFYERMGRAYVEKHEAGVRSLHRTVRAAVAGPLSEVEAARTAMKRALAGRKEDC